MKEQRKIVYADPLARPAARWVVITRRIVMAVAGVAALIIVPWLWAGGAWKQEGEKFLDVNHVTVPEGAAATAIRDDELSEYYFVAEGVTLDVEGVTFIVALGDEPTPEGATVRPIVLGDATGIWWPEGPWAKVTLEDETWIVTVEPDSSATAAEIDAAWGTLIGDLEFAAH